MSDLPEPKWGPSGEEVYNRTYARTLPDGTRENWAQTVRRVVAGNLALVYGDDEDKWTQEIHDEAAELCGYIYSFAILPAGRHLWATGVKSGMVTQNCFVAPQGSLPEHVRFMMVTLMAGGGVGARYGLDAHNYWPPTKPLRLHLVCDPTHPDHAALKAAGVLSQTYSDEWTGAYPVADSREGWSDALVDLVDTFYRDDVHHVDRVYDLAHIRPAGARLKSSGGTASGPVPFARMLHDVAAVLNRSATTRHHLTGLDVMEIDHAIAAAVVAGGVRRSARMSIMHWTDTDIFRFIDCKQDLGMFTTNISVAIDEAFLAAAEKEGTQARRVLDAVIAGMLANGEPGLFNQDLANVKELGKVMATNPCGEIALEPYEPCVLGQINMEYFTGGDMEREAADMVRAHMLLTRFLIRATFAPTNFAESRRIMDRNRRIGLGHTGIAGYLARMGVKYSEASDSPGLEMLLVGLKRAVDQAAANYAFELRIPLPIKRTALAPTGTISKLPGSTEGIAPIFGRYYIRRIRFSKTNPDQAARIEELRELGYDIEDDLFAADTAVVSFPMEDVLLGKVDKPDVVEDQSEVSLDSRLALQELYQRCMIDNAISQTLTIDASTSAKELRGTILRWLPSLKGLTAFPEMSHPQSPYERITKSQYETMTAPKGVGNSDDEECAGGACPIR
jgi:ribonucleoside-triphosphate reductase